MLFYNLDKQAAFIFGAFWVLVHFVAPLPKFKGPNKVKIYQGVELEGLLKRDRELAGKGVKTQLRMVEFYCTWSPPCQYLVPDYAAVSMRYSSDAFQFGKIDADRNSAISKMFQVRSCRVWLEWKGRTFCMGWMWCEQICMHACLPARPPTCTPAISVRSVKHN